MKNTKEIILDTAEQLFAEHGFEATSLRTITSAARVNLAAVNYHFKSKDQLLQALFTRGMQRLNQKRLALLEINEAEYGKNPIPIEKLVHTLIDPMFGITENRPKDSITFSMLLGRMYSSPQGALNRVLLDDIGKFAERFESALRHTLPDISLEDLYWRSFFAIGATAHTLASSHLLEIISHGLCKQDDRKAALEKLVTFIIAGLSVPATSGNPQKRSTRAAKTDKGR